MALPQLFEVATGFAAGVQVGQALFVEPVDIGGDGHTIDFAWDSVDGATAVELDDAGVTLSPDVAETLMPDQPATADGNGWRVNIPSGARVRAIGLKGFKGDDDNEIVDAPTPGRRIVVAFPNPQGGGFDSPRFAVPAVGTQGAVPQTLTGASLAARTLTLDPAVAAPRLRLALVDGDTPSEFNAVASQLDALQLLTHTAARNAALTGPAGETLWQVPEFDPAAADTTVDLRQSLKATFDRQVKAGEPLAARLLLKADTPARCRLYGAHARGSLLRRHEGIASTTLEGDALPLAVFGGGTLAAETPSSVRGDLTIRYAGLRVLDELSDAPPGPTAAVQGLIVGSAGTLRGWPPDALTGRAPARIGVYGRAPEAAELALELVELNGRTAGRTLAQPALLKLSPADGLRTHWAVLPKPAALPRGVGLRLRCNVGRFHWAVRADGEPIVRLAVLDPDPGGRPLRLGGTLLANVATAELHRVGFAFPAAAFRGGVPLAESSLFLQVDCSDLTLRYAR